MSFEGFKSAVSSIWPLARYSVSSIHLNGACYGPAKVGSLLYCFNKNGPGLSITNGKARILLLLQNAEIVVNKCRVALLYLRSHKR